MCRWTSLRFIAYAIILIMNQLVAEWHLAAPEDGLIHILISIEIVKIVEKKNARVFASNALIVYFCFLFLFQLKLI